ncbi:hypothetical protein V6N13_088516 [Hibiscus sabdariffa]
MGLGSRCWMVSKLNNGWPLGAQHGILDSGNNKGDNQVVKEFCGGKSGMAHIGQMKKSIANRVVVRDVTSVDGLAPLVSHVSVTNVV